MVEAFENGWDKYRVTLRDIEGEREETRERLEGFLEELGYVGEGRRAGVPREGR